jgi:hypothetical protein
VRASIIGNVGTLIALQIGHDDGEELAPVFDRDPEGVFFALPRR